VHCIPTPVIVPIEKVKFQSTIDCISELMGLFDFEISLIGDADRDAIQALLRKIAWDLVVVKLTNTKL
jgi:hypothetical protein